MSILSARSPRARRDDSRNRERLHGTLQSPEEMEDHPRESRLWPFLAGVVAGGAGALLASRLWPRRGFDPRLIRSLRPDAHVPPVVVVPGILGSELVRPDGTRVWLNLGNAFGYHDLSLPFARAVADIGDDLVPTGLLGVDTVLPRVFGFTEYADLLDLLEGARFRRDASAGASYHVFAYDWRRDLVDSARRLHEALESLADARGDRDARFNVIGHSMGGLVARYYLRFGTAEPEESAEVTWAGARRIQNLLLVAAPMGGSIPALDAILNGNRVGLSYTTLAASVIARMPAIYQLLPPAGTGPLLAEGGAPMAADLHDIATWERLGWGPFNPIPPRRRGDVAETKEDREAHKAFLSAALSRARAFHCALARPVPTPCPSRVIVLGGDCLPTLAHAVVPRTRGAGPRFEPMSRVEAERMYEAGDGRVTRASVLASHIPGAEESETGSGMPEVSHAFLGSADHHGIYSEPTFQSILVRTLLRPSRRLAAAALPEPAPVNVG
jgi:pimeloyl-ACP methyl ester carboxylesterase